MYTHISTCSIACASDHSVVVVIMRIINNLHGDSAVAFDSISYLINNAWWGKC